MEYSFVLIYDAKGFLSEREATILLEMKKKDPDNTIAVGLLTFKKIEHVKPIIDGFYSNRNIGFILLITTETDTCHIYKLDKEVEDNKDFILKRAYTVYHKTIDESFNFPTKFNNLIEFMKMGGHKIKNLS